MPESSFKLDISGPSVDDDIRRLIWRYGAEEVREAVKRQTAGQRGRIPSGDWSELSDVLREDARRWLDGGAAEGARSNRSIAREFAAKYREQSEEATYRRIMGKLSKRRRYYTLVEAVWLSQHQFSHMENLRAVRELVAIGIRRDLWHGFLRQGCSTLITL